MTPEVPCAHCGLPAPGGGVGPAFCCAGCRAAHEMFHAAGLDGYYRLRERLGDDAPRPAAEAAARDADRRYLAYDEPAFRAEHGGGNDCIDLHVSGLHCAACVWALEQLPRVLPGVTDARVSLASQRLHLRWEPNRIRPSEIATFVHRLGYPTHSVSADADQERAAGRRRELLRLGVSGAIAGNVMMMSIALYAGAFSGMEARFEALFGWASAVLAVGSVTYGAWPFYRGAVAGLRLRTLHMDLPISLGVLVGFLASVRATVTGSGEVYYDTIAILVFLLLAGRQLQSWGQSRAATASEVLHALAPSVARRRTDGDWASVYVDDLNPGDVLQVRTGEVFPADGTVVEGTGHVDRSSLTGESRPVPMSPGSAAHAGSRNVGAPLVITAERWGRASRIGRLVSRLESGEAERAPIVQTADRVAGWFVGAVILLAAGGGIAWWTVDPTRTFDVVVSLLVVSCPCALGLATPIALAVARGQALRSGIFIKSAASLEALAGAKEVVLDKTGTLTRGALTVSSCTVGVDLLPRLAAVESRTDHPVGRAIHAYALGAGEPFGGAVEVDERPGRGMEARVDGHLLRIGSSAWLTHAAAELRAEVDAVLGRGATPVLVELDGAAVGILAVEDTLRDDAVEGVARLRARGLALSIWSGDHPRVVKGVASALGIAEHRGHASPEDKAARVRGRPHTVMVGDGINDAPALSAAAVGVAVSGGAETAMQVAHVYLTSPGVGTVADLLDGAIAAARVVRRNLGFSLAYNVVFASLALAGMITPLAAAILMPISSLTVIGSSVLARSFGPGVAQRRNGTPTRAWANNPTTEIPAA